MCSVSLEMTATHSVQIDPNVLIFEAPKEPIRLSANPKMGFVQGFNVNYEQRDQYKCDAVNVNTGKRTNSLTMIQGEKISGNKHISLPPRFTVSILIHFH